MLPKSLEKENGKENTRLLKVCLYDLLFARNAIMLSKPCVLRTDWTDVSSPYVSTKGDYQLYMTHWKAPV